MWYDLHSGGDVLNIEDWKSQIKRGTLAYCVLLLIAQKDSYGYEIINELSKYSIVATKESTTYPLLRQLEKDNCLPLTGKIQTRGYRRENIIPSRQRAGSIYAKLIQSGVI